MARWAYIRCQRKQEIEEFEQEAKADKLFIDLSDEFGNTYGGALKDLIDQLGDDVTEVIVRDLQEVADNVAQLSCFLISLRSNAVDLVILNTNGESLLTEDGYMSLMFVRDFIKKKESLQKERQSKPGRNVQPYPLNFLEVYTSYRKKELNGLDAAKKLSVSYNKFRELVNVFELRI